MPACCRKIRRAGALPLDLRRDALGLRNLRSALPMNLKARYPGLQDMDRAHPTSSASSRSGANAWPTTAGRICSAAPCVADAMFAPVVTRFVTYDVKLDSACAAYCKSVMAMPQMQEWLKSAMNEPEELEELDVDSDSRRVVLLHLGAGALHHVLPFGKFDTHHCGELLRGAACRFVADLTEPFLEGRRRHRAVERLVKLAEHITRQPSWSDDAAHHQASQLHLPAVCPYRFFTQNGGLVSYSIDQIDQWPRGKVR